MKKNKLIYSLLGSFLFMSPMLQAYPGNDFISDGSDIIHHEVKKTQTIVAEIVFNKKSTGTVDLSVTDGSFSTESKNFTLDKNKIWLTLSGAKFKDKSGVVGTIWNIDEDGEATSFPIVKIIPKEGYDMKIKGTSVEIKFTYK